VKISAGALLGLTYAQTDDELLSVRGPVGLGGRPQSVPWGAGPGGV